MVVDAHWTKGDPDGQRWRSKGWKIHFDVLESDRVIGYTAGLDWRSSRGNTSKEGFGR
jgi:hypothetical protein